MEEIFQTYLTATNDDLNGAAGKLKEMTPSPMNTMLEKETKSDAIKKKQERSKKVVEDVPPTTPGIRNTSILFVPFFNGGGGGLEKNGAPFIDQLGLFHH